MEFYQLSAQEKEILARSVQKALYAKFGAADIHLLRRAWPAPKPTRAKLYSLVHATAQTLLNPSPTSCKLAQILPSVVSTSPDALYGAAIRAIPGMTEQPRHNISGPAVSEPADQDSLAHVLWCILGGSGMYMTLEANRLGISLSCLSGILRGHQTVNREWLEKKGIRALLQEYHPENWLIYGLVYDMTVAKLETKKNKTRGKDNRKSVTTVADEWRHAAAALLVDLLHQTGDDICDVARDSTNDLLRIPNVWKRFIEVDFELKPSVVKACLIEINALYNIAERPIGKHNMQSLMAICDQANQRL